MDVSTDLNISSLSLDSLSDASFLLVNYIYSDHWKQEQFEECLQKINQLLHFHGAELLIAWHKEKPCGFIALNWGFSTTKGQPFLTIQDLFVLEKFRKNGVGKALIQKSIDFAVKNRANRLQLNTGTDNKKARRLYHSLGFEWFPNKEIYMFFLR